MQIFILLLALLSLSNAQLEDIKVDTEIPEIMNRNLDGWTESKAEEVDIKQVDLE